LIVFALAPAAFVVTTRAQAKQLTLADIIVALRSNKVSLDERNRLLAEAVSSRGTTFSLTPEIEKELSDTGAGRGLLDSIRQRSPIVKISSTALSSPQPTPAPEKPKVLPPAPPPDAAFYEKRADESLTKGEADAAIADYTKAIELKPNASKTLKGRANSYFAKGLYAQAVTDLTRVIELEPADASAYARRAQAYEKQGTADLALEDYKKAYQLDANNEVAKPVVEKWAAEQAKAAVPVAEPPAALPEFVDLGMLSETTAVRMVKPVYPASAKLTGAAGQVTVDVELDTEGNVTKAKSISGNALLRRSSEEAARDSKFKPASVGGKPVKARGRIVYNFISTR
jgi:TonB family protein